MIDIYVMDTNIFSDQQLYENVLQLLRSDRLAKIRSIKHEQGQKLSAAAGFLLLYGMKQAGVPLALIKSGEMVTGEHGKPMFKNEEIGMQFNLSHSGTKVACVISDSECGVDIERVNERRVKEPLIKKVCTQEESDILLNMDEVSGKKLFFKLWTIKESVMKKGGQGFTMNPTDIEASKMLTEDSMKRGEDYIYSFPPNPLQEDYYLSVCCGEAYKKQPLYVDKAAVCNFLTRCNF